MRRARRLAAAVVLALAACDKPKPPACPGEPIGTFSFTGDLIPASDACPFGPAARLAFTATLAYGSTGEAWLCPERQEAQPMAGTRSGDHLVLSSPAAVAYGSGCACTVGVVESVEGDVAWADGMATAFSGELRNAFAPTDPAATAASCAPDAGAADGGERCGAPCQLRWRLEGQR